MEGLEIFAPEPRRVDLIGRSVEVLPLRLGQLPGFLKAVEPAMPLLMQENWVAAVMDHMPEMQRAVEIATGVTAAEQADLYPDEGLRLAVAVLEVNADFFVRRLLPEITRATAAIRAVTEGAGPSSSPGSAPEGTASPTSSD